MDEFKLTAEEEAEAARIEDILKAQAAFELKQMARLLASRSNRRLFGETEFQIRDVVHRIGARGLEAALEERNRDLCSRRRTWGTAGPA